MSVTSPFHSNPAVRFGHQPSRPGRFNCEGTDDQGDGHVHGPDCSHNHGLDRDLFKPKSAKANGAAPAQASTSESANGAAKGASVNSGAAPLETEARRCDDTPAPDPAEEGHDPTRPAAPAQDKPQTMSQGIRRAFKQAVLWLKELFTGFWQDLRDVLKGPTPHQHAHDDGHVHGPGCGHDHHQHSKAS